MIRADAMKAVKGYDENIFLYAEESTLGIKLKRKNIALHLLTQYTFTHYHSVSINKTIKSVQKQNKMIWKSRKYVLKQYFHFNHFELFIVNILECFTELIFYIKNKR